MNISRRGTFRSSRNIPRESTRDISEFVRRKEKEELVEIDDDEDDVQDLTDQFAFADEELEPIPVKRKRRRIILEEESDDGEDIFGAELGLEDNIDENEKKQIKEALRQSQLDMKSEAKRRAANRVQEEVDSFTETNTRKSLKTTEDKSLVEDETQDYLQEEIQSSPVSSGIERQQVDRSESPDLFVTPSSSYGKEEFEDALIEERDSQSKSPLKSKKSFSTDDIKKSNLGKDIIIQITPVKRQLDSNNKNKLKLKKGKDSAKEPEKETKVATSTKLLSENKKEESSLESKKRKHLDDGDDDSGDEFVAKDAVKKQKTIEHIFNIKNLKKEDHNRQKREAVSTTHVVINDDNDDDDNGGDDNQENGKVLKRNDSTCASRVKKAVTTRLERAYKKPKLSIKSIADAMKARLYFAPPGIQPKTYTYAIMRMMDHTRKCIYRAQRKSLNFIKWGKPIVVGPRQGNSLDARKEKKKSNVGVASTSTTLTPSPGTASEVRKKSLRSAQTNTNPPEVKSEPDTTCSEGFKRSIGYIDDSDDDDLTKPVFGEVTSHPKSWKEFSYLPKTEFGTFGENVVTSSEHKEKSVSSTTVTKETSASSSCPSNADISRNVTPGEKGEMDASVNEILHGGVEMNGKLTNTQKTVHRDFPVSSSDTNNENTPTKYTGHLNDEATKTKQENTTANKQNINVSELYDNEEEIDSSIEIELNKSKKKVKKALIKDVEDEESNSSLPETGIRMTTLDDNLIGSLKDSCTLTEPNRDSKPGASLTKVTVKSGYLKVDRSPEDTPEKQRVVSSAAKRAAEAAERRMKATTSSSPEISSSVEQSQENIPSTGENRVECPMCFTKFFKEDIERHAATCDGSRPKSNQDSFSPRRGAITNNSTQRSIGSPAEEQHNKDLGLKSLRVMVTRSPEAHRKLMEQRSLSGSKARRSLSLSKTNRASTSVQNEGDKSLRSRRYIDMTSDDDTPEQDKGDVEQDKDASQEDSQTKNWFSSSSQIERKKSKYKFTYDGKKKKGLASRSNTFATLDFVPVGECPSSGEQKHDDVDAIDNNDNDDKYDGDNKNKNEENKEKKDDNIDKGKRSNFISLATDEYGNIDSDSDDSEVELLANYGVKIKSTRKREREDSNKRNINDILRPQRQGKTKKTKREDDFDEEDYQNEKALLELSGVPSKRCKVDRKSNERSTKRRHRRISSSDESEENNDEYEQCFICFERVVKEDFKDHTEACLEKKGEAIATPGKGLSEAGNPDSYNRRRSTKQSKPGSSSQTIEMDSDEISNSPIKTFKLIGEESGSSVDFSNQFAFFGKGGESKRGSRGGGRGGGKKNFRSGNFRNRGKSKFRKARGKRKY